MAWIIVEEQAAEYELKGRTVRRTGERGKHSRAAVHRRVNWLAENPWLSHIEKSDSQVGSFRITKIRSSERYTYMPDSNFPYSEQIEELAQLHYFSVKKRYTGGEIEIRITVKEFAMRNAQGMRFYAQTDQSLNQAAVAFQPFGWGETMSEALRECLTQIRQYRYQD
jgi:hypothetical protein